MDIKATIIQVTITALLTLSLTAIFNWLIAKPKERKQENEKAEQERQDIKSDLRTLKEYQEKAILETKKIDDKLYVHNLGLQAVLKSDLMMQYETWIKRKYAPAEIRDNLEHMYTAYEGLGEDGVIDSLRQKFLALPLSITKKSK